MTSYIIDSYAWIEYFIGSKKGERVRKLFDDEDNSFFALDCCLAEIHGWALKNNQDAGRLLRIIRADSDILHVKENDWVEAGLVRYDERKEQEDFGLIDSALIVKQKEMGCQIISGDLHFKGKKGIIFLI